MFKPNLAALVLIAIGVGGVVSSTAEAAHRRRGYGHRGYRGGFYPSFHLGYSPGFYPSVGVGLGYYPVSVGFSFLGGAKDPRGVVRFEVYPKQAEVYIDGYYAGIVDDFGKLRLEPGPHDITIYLDGYRVFEETVYSTAGSTVKIHHEMEPLAEGEPPPPRPAVPGAGSRAAPASPPPGPALTTRPPSPSPPPPSASVTTPATFGVLALRTQPAGAEIHLDGERWLVPEGDDRLIMHLPIGRYQLELRKPGYEPFLTMIEVKEKETTAVNVLLAPAP